MNISKNVKGKLAVWTMMIALFFNPLGFDIVQLWLIEMTGSIWRANFAMYCTAGLFFGLSMLFRILSRKDSETSED